MTVKREYDLKTLNFKTNARHVGQLGRELVTDFVTALVELIKNSYDADAYGVKIILENPNTPNSRIILADTGSGMSRDDFENKWMVIGTNNKISEPYTPKGRKKAGQKGIGRFSVERLAEKVSVYSFTKDESPFKVSINWNSFEDFNSETILQKIVILRNRQDVSAAKYINCQLDAFFESVKVSDNDKQNVKHILGLSKINYTSFFDLDTLDLLENEIVKTIKKYENVELLIGDVGAELEELTDEESLKYNSLLASIYADCNVQNQETGMILVMEGLRDDWKQKDIDKLQKELRLLVAPNFIDEVPFKIELSAKDFRVDDIVLVNEILDLRFAEVDAKISDHGQKKQIIYKDNNGTEVNNEHNLEHPLLCGDLELKLYYFIRDSKHLARPGAGYNFRYAQQILDTYCGVKIYRDNFRVKPYGDIGNDWLLLDQAKVRDTHGYLVGNNQVIGVVRISDKSNPQLVDATNREGIIENEAYTQLVDFVKECTTLISEIRKDEYLKNKENKFDELKEKKKKIDSSIESIAKASGSNQETISKIIKIKQDYDSYYENLEDAYKEEINYQQSELNLYKNLASLGILTGSFGHETSDIVSRILVALQLINVNLDKPQKHEDVRKTLQYIRDDFSRIFSYTSLIDGFLRKKKRSINNELSFEETLNDVCILYRDIIKSFNIDLLSHCDSTVSMKMAQIDLESIIINMITNAYEQVKGKKHRIISVDITQNISNIVISFQDSGSGVPADMRKKIFMPFMTTKENGIGLGLNIVKDIVDRYHGTIVITNSQQYGGARFDIFLPKEESD